MSFLRPSPPPGATIGDLSLPAPPEFLSSAGRLARWVEPITPAVPLARVRDLFTANDALLALPVVDAGGAPVGLVHRYRLLERLEGEARSRVASLTAGAVMERSPLVVDAATPVDSLGTLILAGPRPHVSDAFMVTRSGRYAGLGTGLDLVRALSERRDAELRRMAEHDMLTGLPNRHLFDERLSQALARAAGTDRVAVLLVDLDRVREINDTYGHRFGDLVLCGVSQRLRAALRRSDVVARLSGDEFAVVLSDINTAADAEAVARVLVASCRAPLEVHGREVAVSCSIGVAVLPDDAATAETLVRAAGAALSRAKEVRNVSRRFTQEMAEGRYPIPALGALIHALDTRQLAVHYQPIASLASGRITSVEALVRWTHPTLGQVPASEVVRLAEESGLMVAVSEFVMRTALRQMKEWDLATGCSDLHLAVNISAVQVQEGGLVAMCDRLIAETGFDPGRVELELTESAAMRSSPAVLNTLQALKERGFMLSIDDFGMGYSSLSRLERLPISVVKIDRSFVQGIGETGRGGALAKAVIAMGQSLGMRLVGEGVETEEQLAFLEAEGCDYVQGYLLARPRPAEDLTPMLAAGLVITRRGEQAASIRRS